MWRFIPTLLWKSWCIRKRHYIYSFLELFLPIGMYMLILYIKYSAAGSHDILIGNQTYEPVDKESIISLPYNFNAFKIEIMYAPDNDPKVKSIMSKAVSSLKGHSYSVDVQSAPNEKNISDTFYDKYGNTSEYGVLIYGVIFSSNLSYTLRPISKSMATDTVFPVFSTPGPGTTYNVYFKEGFLALQIVINDALSELLNPDTQPLKFSLTEFPYPAYHKMDTFKLVFSMIIPLLTMFGYYVMAPNLITNAIHEKNSGSREWMGMVGIPRIMILFSWVMHSMSFYLVTTIINSIILVANIVGNSIITTTNFFVIWIILFLFCTSTVFFLLASTSFINNPNVAVIFGSIVWILPSVAVSNYQNAKNMGYVAKIFTCFFPSVNLNWAFTAISGFEANHEEVTITNLFKLHNGQNNDVPLGLSLIFFLGTIVLYCLLFLYIDSVKPGKFGRARPWHFLFSDLMNLFQSKNFKNDKPSSVKRSDTFEGVENLSVGLSFHSVQKHFGNVTAVEDVSIDIYKGQITALLGHNGAGKTTLINIITGMFSPTKGEIWKDGNNVFDNFGSFQKNLGLCPQHDLLFPYLNVIEHVMFFGMLRGLSRAEARKEAIELLEFFGISDKSTCLSKKLSGGMKRKLSLSISLVGKPEIIILDEPTSGMDPESRRDTWNKLLALRGGRTIILTTHYMEEADVLGDMIAIMDHGLIKCYGTSLFLKRQYGSGYKVNIPIDDHNQITNIVKTYVPEASVMPIPGSVSFSLPLERSAVFTDLFASLEKNLPATVNIGVSCTTLDDVFLKVAHSGVDEIDNVNCDEEHLLSDSKADDIHSSSEALTPKPLVGFALMWSRICALIMKKLLYNYHRWASWLFLTILYPFIVFLIPLTITTAILKGELSNPILPMELSIYGDTDVIVSPPSSGYDQLFNSFKSIIKSEGSHPVQENNSSIINALLDVGTENLSKFRFSYIIAANLSTNEANIFYSSIGFHSPAIAVSTLYNAWLSVGNNINTGFKTFNHPFDFQEDVCNPETQMVLASVPPSIWLFTVPTVLAVISYSYSRLHHDERLNSGKLLQLMTGTSPFLYWFSAFLCDFFLFTINCLFALLYIYIFDTASLLLSSTDFGILFLIMILSCCGNTWFGYLNSYFLRTFSRLFSINILFVILFGQVAYFIITIIKLIEPNDATSVLDAFHHILMFYPSYCTCALIFKVIKHFATYSLIDKCNQGTGIIIEQESLFTWDNKGINPELVYITVDCFIFAVIILLVDYGVFSKAINYVFKLYAGTIDQASCTYDADVENERSQVEDIMNLQGNNSYIVVDSLGKKYSRKETAVRNVSFIVPKGECFGLLGVNGAGKSTTFKMLTGDLYPTVGKAVIFGDSLDSNKLRYQSHIGYCPQTDAIIEDLTGVEMLKLYASLRGVNPSIFNRTISFWLSEFGLQNVSDRRCETYSGGNKRKLSTAISLIGEPQVVFLDEPTTGVDPVARRKFWSILSKLQKKGCTIILTSHSMDECETVCDRLTIMVKGEMKCIGNIRRLKEIYGQGFTVLIQLGIHSATQLSTLKSDFTDKFSPHAILRDEHIGLLHYHINSPDYKWSNLFSIMEGIKEKYPFIKEYVITETTLEQIFLHFAKI